MQKEFNDLWKLITDNSFRNRTWHWWWWLFFFENPERPDYPLQLMILWGTRNCKKVRINDFMWEPKITPKLQAGQARFESVVASWYYDGEKMHDPLILENGATTSEWSDDHGAIVMKNKHGNYSFQGKDADFELKAENPDITLDFRMQFWTNYLAELVPSGKVFVGNMGYSMLKYRGLLASGKIRMGDSEIEVKGRSYFQKVRISSITPAWYWATIQWDCGAYMQYFLPHVGIPMLRQKYKHRSAMDWGEKMVSRSLYFYEPTEKKEYILRDIHIRKRYENDLPVFTVNARSADTELTAEMATYGRCCWNITQPFIWPTWLGIFYNEYPARLIDFKFRHGNHTLDMEDLGPSYCNCEHSWGTI